MSDINEANGVRALKKQNYSVFAIVCIIYCSVSAGAFGVEEIIGSCGPGMTICVLVGMAIFWALPDCFRTAEMASVMPGEGGYYYWSKHTMGEFWAFFTGWGFAISYYVCSSTYVVLAVNYLSTVIPMTNAQAIVIKVAIIIIFTVVNLMGLKDVSRLSIIFAVVILLLFATVTVVGFTNWNSNPVEPFVPEEVGVVGGISLGIGLGVWLYCGWGSVTMLAGEVSNPQVISKALRIVVPLSALTYLLPTLAGLSSIGHWEQWTTVGSEGIGFSAVLNTYLGHGAEVAFVLIAMVAAVSIFNTNMAGGSRSFFVLADDHLFPRKGITKVSKNRGVPYVGILSLSIVTLLMMQMSFKTLVLIQVIPVLSGEFFMAFLVFRTRKSIPIDLRKGCYIVGGGKVGLYVATLLPAVIAVIAFYLNGMDYFLYGLLFLMTAVILYPIIKIKLGGLAVTKPDRYPTNPKTHLAFGDLFRISKLLAIIGALGISGFFIFLVLEGDWGPAYYAATYGSGLLSSFEGMRYALLIGGIVCVAIALALYVIGKKVDEKMQMPVKVDVSIGQHPEEELKVNAK